MTLFPFTKRKLSLEQATAVAESQFDLGGLSKKDMVIALSGCKATTQQEEVNIKNEAYKRLDPFSRFIVDEMLCQDSIEESLVSIEYAIANLKSLKNALKNIEIAT